MHVADLLEQLETEALFVYCVIVLSESDHKNSIISYSTVTLNFGK